MKKILGTITVLLTAVIVHAQVSVKGFVTDTLNKPLIGATVSLEINSSQKNFIAADENGFFEFDKIPANSKDKIVVQHVGRKTIEKIFDADKNIELHFSLEELSYFLEPLEVKAVRASDRAPFTKTNISQQQIEKENLGQDLPFLLNQTPSLYVSSDAGNGVGYTYMHIRGSDATRINVTLNGIPYNDGESEQTYFVDLPDFTSSVNSIQIQRGVGTSTNGSGAFGATINLSTNEFIDTAYAEINNSYGSFNTWKNTIKVGSGLINDHFTIDARLSQITSDGYIDRASSNLQSFYLSGAYISKKTSIRLNVISGKEKTYQAWYGVPQDSLATHRTYNPAGEEDPNGPYANETDNYWQKHFQLFFNQYLNPHLSLNITSFYTRGYGYYEEYHGVAAETEAGDNSETAYAYYGLPNVVNGNDTITNTDLIRQLWLSNYFYGQIFSLQYKKNKDEITYGGSWTEYYGKHYDEVTWAQFGGVPDNYIYANYPAYKTDVNFYVKWLRQLNQHWSVFGDMQYRYVRHEMDGFEGNPDLFITRYFNFLNPKGGISFYKNGWNGYFSYALGHKEPDRDDFQASPEQQPTYETMHDFEAGISKKTSRYNFGVTLYYMLYVNQLVLTGKLNDVGDYTRINVPNSYRAGIELEGGIAIVDWLKASANLSFSKNKIQNFTEYFDDYDNGEQVAQNYHNTDISFSPSIIGGATISFLPTKKIEIDLLNKYVSKQYMDNTEDELRSLNSFFTEDFRAIYTVKHFVFKEWNIIAQVNNIFNKLYQPNGSTYPYIYGGALVNDNYYSPMAGTNFMLAMNVKF
jgi:iron complex outermembrane receptor protein